MTRGIENCNPGNIRRSGSRWVGVRQAKTDKEFVQFETMSYGLRALMILIRNYIRKGINTPSKIIYRYAPPSENNTDAYIGYVRVFLDDKPIVPFSDEFFELVALICLYESKYRVSVDELYSVAKYFQLCK